jgi:hypothetical protein
MGLMGIRMGSGARGDGQCAIVIIENCSYGNLLERIVSNGLREK